MNISLVIHLLGYLGGAFGVLSVLPLITAILHREAEVWTFALIAAFGIGIGALLLRLGSPGGAFGHREAFATVTLGWFFAAVVGAVPFYLTGSLPNPVDALFESMSAITTTGATVLTDIEGQSRSLLFWRSFLQWIGGMGIIGLTLAVLPRLGSGGLHLLRAEMPGPETERVRPTVRQTALIFWSIYLGLSAVEVLALRLTGLDWYNSVLHTFATMSTGGFSTRTASIEAFQSPAVEWVIIFFMTLAGANFALHYLAIVDRKPLVFWRDAEFKFYLYLIGGASLFVTVHLWGILGMGLAEAVRKATFQVVSLLTSTGFTSADYGVWPAATQLILLLTMFVGGSAGSTAGGMKVIRVLGLIKFAQRELARLIHPRAVIALHLGRRPLKESVIGPIVGFATLYILLFVISSLVLSLFGLDLLTSFGAAATTLGNVGPGLAGVGPTETYAPLHPFVKIWLTVLMLLGRLEIYTVLVLFSPAVWRR